jgi:hypothetical protein
MLDVSSSYFVGVLLPDTIESSCLDGVEKGLKKLEMSKRRVGAKQSASISKEIAI